MRTRAPQQSGRVIAAEERAELQCLLDAIPVGALRGDERIRAFVHAFRRVHVPAHVARYAIHRLPFEARADLLNDLRAALSESDLRIYPAPNCRCGPARRCPTADERAGPHDCAT